MQNHEPIMIFHAFIDPAEITDVRGGHEAVTMIPFRATVASPLFTGETAPGAVDVQQENAAGLRSLCARYAFRGTDRDGTPCTLFVENCGWIRPGQSEPVLHTCPRFLTDSPALAPYLSRHAFRAEVHGTDRGVDIHVFDTEAEG